MTTEQLYHIYLQHPAVTTDSRNCPEGSLFFALKGESFDGNQYAQAALDKGCAYAIVDDTQVAGNDKIILVDNVLKALQDLAHHHRIALGLPVIGITGTNGKTTTKELISAVLAKKFKVLFTQGNLNNHIGVPLTLLSITPQHNIAVVEMGANHIGEIKALVDIAAPNAGIITNVGKAHLEGFGSFEGVIKAKSEMYDFVRETGGVAFVNLDNPILMEKSEGIDRIGYGIEHKNGLVNGIITGNSPFLEMSWHASASLSDQEGDNSIYPIKTNLIGAYNAENVLASICIGTYFGVEPQQICDAMSNYQPHNNRSQFTQTEKNKLIIDAYNANPTSMQAALANFAQMTADNKTVILGDMRELGEDSAKEHQHIVDLLTENNFSNIYLIGECFSATQTGFTHFAKTDDFIQYLQKNPISNKTILIKGSRGSRLETVVPYL